VPFTITATASDPDGYVENVTLWYNWSSDNSTWQTWTEFGTDVDNSDGWSWSFTAPAGDNYYKFYSIAQDNAGNVEGAPADADQWCGVDTTEPTILSVLINGGDDLTDSTEATVSIDAYDATSGLAEMQFSDDNVDWSAWEPFATTKSYTLPEGDGLKTVYVRVRDVAGLVSAIASDSITLETVPPPPAGAFSVIMGTITAGTTGSADFTQYAIAVTRVRITAETDVQNVRVDVVVLPTVPSGVPAVGSPVYSYFDITTTIDTAHMREATIEFRVPRSWVARHDIDEQTIELLKYAGGWESLPTQRIGADSAYLYFEAKTSGFSLFAVAGQRRVAPPPPVVAPPPPPAPAPPLVPPVFYALLSMIAAAGSGLALYYVWTRPMKPFVPLERLKRAVLPRRVRRREVTELELAEELERLKRVTRVRRVRRPTKLEELKRAAARRPRRRRRRRAEERKVAELLKGLRRAAKHKKRSSQ
jgi:PGF-pre-PGF domain-containing protein